MENFLKPINSHINALSTLFTDVPVFFCNVKLSAAVAIFVSVACIYLLQLSTQFRPGWIVMEREEELR